MNRALWGFALIVDTLAILATWPFFASEPSAASVGWGVVLVALFGALLVLLLKPAIFGSHAGKSAKVLCVAVPAIAFVGSLDTGSISEQEFYAIVVAALVGWLNWAAFRRHAVVVPKAA